MARFDADDIAFMREKLRPFLADIEAASATDKPPVRKLGEAIRSIYDWGDVPLAFLVYLILKCIAKHGDAATIEGVGDLLKGPSPLAPERN